MKRLFVFSILITLFLFSLQRLSARDNHLLVGGYGEMYYSFDFARPFNHAKQSFLYAYNRHNTFVPHLAMIKAKYCTDDVRGNTALMAGTYANDNTAAEQGLLKSIYEANLGITVSKSADLWIDAGVLPSHIGWESAEGIDCPTLTRSIAAENSPYFESRIRLSYTSVSKRWYLSGLLLN